PHCQTLEPAIEEWLHNDKPENAEYVPMPAVLGNSWALLARAYYTFEAMGVLDELHPKVFAAIHDKGMRFTSIEQVADWAAAQGVDRRMVIDTFDSFAVDTKLRYAQLMSERYGINGVPAVIVDGKYRTSVSLAGGQEELFKVINYLVKLAASEREQTPKESG
ncbi:MAG: thiol:disulfide interchange protein DsbA/DsbL, partial [Pseudomonadota bacterium]|nr:thiol:disulfide interchange protein DsbA/DsbL [Pseudomonadota bacterium]